MDNRSLRELVISYLGGRCLHCGFADHLDIHHTLPLYAGGKNTMGNVELACKSCHKKLHTQLIKLYPTTEQDKIPIRIIVANIEIDEADKVEAADAIKSLIDSGTLSKDEVPEELRLLL